MLDEYDVFLAHNSADKPLVRIIAAELKKYNLNPWLDEEQILPGRSFQNLIQSAVLEVKSAAVFVGAFGFGEWQKVEIETLMRQCRERKMPVIPVLLYGVSEMPDSALFLSNYKFVSFEDGVDDKKALLDLVRGITGDKSLRRNSFPPDDLSDSFHENAEDAANLYDSRQLFEGLRNSKHFSLQQIVEFIESYRLHIRDQNLGYNIDLDMYIKKIRHQESITVDAISEIDAMIKSIEIKICEELEKELVVAIAWLEEEKKPIAERIVTYILGKDDTNQLADRESLCWNIEKVVEITRHHLLTDEKDILHFVENMSIPYDHLDFVSDGVSQVRRRLHMKKWSRNIRDKVDFSLSEIAKCIDYERDSRMK